MIGQRCLDVLDIEGHIELGDIVKMKELFCNHGTALAFISDITLSSPDLNVLDRTILAEDLVL